MAERPAARPPAVLLVRYWLPVLAYLAAVQLVGALPEVQVPMIFPNADKLVHVVEYGTLGVLLARACRASFPVSLPLRTALIAVVLGVFVGASDEFVQAFVPGRISSINDLLADTTGLLFAQLLFLFVVRE